MKQLLRSDYLKNVGTLMLGVGGGQVISILAMFAYTRIYPEEYIGLWGIFFSISLLLRLITNGGYEAAIVLPKTDQEAVQVLNLCLSINVLVGFFTLLLALLSSIWMPIVYPEVDTGLDDILLLLPISVFVEGIIMPLGFWLNRLQKYKSISTSRFAQSLVTVIFSLILGLMGYHLWGLIIGLVAGQIVHFVIAFWSSELPKHWYFNQKQVLQSAKNYKQFIQYGVSGNWFNTLASEAPFLILPRYFGEATVGFFNIARRVLYAPINLIGGSVSTVYYEKATKAHHLGGTALKDLSRSTLKYMILISVVPGLIAFFFGEHIFAFAFGESYRISGLYASWLMPWIFIKFISHPLTYLIDIKLKLKAQLLYNIILFIGQAGILIAMGLCCLALDAVIGFGIIGLVLSAIYLYYLGKLGEIWK